MPTWIGAQLLENQRCRFRVWAPTARSVDVTIIGPNGRAAPLDRGADGYFAAELEDIPSGTLYRYRLDGAQDRPDPASRFQPQGVHGPSAVIDANFPWEDASWLGLPLPRYVIYELHVGTFTSAGTFDAIVPHLAELKDLGITAIELMPVAQFPGSRNWGYDGVLPYAVQDSYGGPQGLKRLVNACHKIGLAVILDVVYNHLGPEGNYLADFGPYFTDRYKTPWGPALNFDGPDSDPVRRYFIDNALYWVCEFHIDALRLDAVHTILDHSPYTFLEQLARRSPPSRKDPESPDIAFPGKRRQRRAPDSLARGWRLRSRRPVERRFSPRAARRVDRRTLRLLRGLRQVSASSSKRSARASSIPASILNIAGTATALRRKTLPPNALWCFAQNHDQVGNRMLGERLSQLVSFEPLKLAAAAVILSPYVPLLFMGEEYGEEAPFQYFISHGDAGLIDAVRNGRRGEFASFGWLGEPPDPAG